MKILCVTHSDRFFVEDRASINAFESRFVAERFETMPPLESFPSVDEAVSFKGKLTIWALDEESADLRFLHVVETGAKIQFAGFHRDKLLVLDSTSLRVLALDFSTHKVIRDPWLVGGHTVFIDDEGFALVTSAPANCVLRVDLESGKVVERIRLPEVYGKGYALSEAFDLHEHFIPTDFQPTHVNCAFPAGDAILLTLLIPGALGFLEPESGRGGRWRYRELIRGFKGCHGGRVDAAGHVYFTDSAAGIVWFLDGASGQIIRRVRVQSNWLHDTVCVDENLLVAGLSDKNTLGVYDRHSGQCLKSVDCGEFGESVMFVNACSPGEEWVASLQLLRQKEPQRRYKVKIDCGPEILIAPTSPRWTVLEERLEKNLLLLSAMPLQHEYMLQSEDLALSSGHYRLTGVCRVRKGKVSLGLLDKDNDKWITTLRFDFRDDMKSVDFQITREMNCSLLVTAANDPGKREVLAEMVRCIIQEVRKPSAEELSDPTATELTPVVGDNLLPEQEFSASWKVLPSFAVTTSTLRCRKPLRYDYLLSSHELDLSPGNYRLGGELEVRSGEVAIGVLDQTEGKWLHQVTFSFNKGQCYQEFSVVEPARVRVIIAAANTGRPSAVDLDIRGVSLREISKGLVLSCAGESSQ